MTNRLVTDGEDDLQRRVQALEEQVAALTRELGDLRSRQSGRIRDVP